MKILDWMHQKIKKGGTIPFKDSSIGSCYSCISTHDDPKYSAYKTAHTISNWRETSNEVEARKAYHEIHEESFEESPVIFQGFLSIGFLGLEPIISEPVTPTFNYLTEEQFTGTEYELSFINDELEKFLDNEDNEENAMGLSSGRNSQASVITLANMQIEGDGLKEKEEEEHENLCPLQHYLFGSSVELPQSREEVKKKMSLRELFYESELSEKCHGDECKGQNINTKEHYKFNLCSVKRLLKKLKDTNPVKPAAGESTVIRKKKKFQKILKILSRKVHPEKTNEKYFIGHSKLDGKFPQSATASETAEINYLSSRGMKSDSRGENKEQWIKTDTDYYVLEL